MKFYFVRVGQMNSAQVLFKFDCLDEAMDFIKLCSESVFTQHVEITLLDEEDI